MVQSESDDASLDAPLQPSRKRSKSQGRQSASFFKLSLGALGIVYGDIGTSPLYAFRECFHPDHGLISSRADIFGILSLLLWSLLWVVVGKYLIFILRADNKGEGGILALLALVRHRGAKWLIPFGLFGAALLYGDGVITPAISVLSAVEGLEISTPALHRFIVPITVAILIGLFSIQARGTERIGRIFGPIMMIWFATLAAIGIPWIIAKPEILQAIHPLHGLRFLQSHGIHGFLVLGAVVLCITGAEALYADMGHFGRAPIRASWFVVVFPALLINYFGQGALVLAQGQAAMSNPFYGLVSSWLQYPLIVISTLATVIASQALISGAFSLTQQAIQLGYLPRTRIEHTSKETEGQIYIAQVNLWLMVGCVLLVLVFQRSSRLAAAYGIAVTGTMVITSILFHELTRRIWRWNRWVSALLLTAFLGVDLAFLGANLVKVAHGGWIPIGTASGLLFLMMTWKKGRDAVAKILQGMEPTLEEFLAALTRKKPIRTPGSAIFLSIRDDVAPPALLHHLRHTHSLHERVLIVTVITNNDPYLDGENRVKLTERSHGFVSVTVHYGFMESPDISEILIHCLGQDRVLDLQSLTFFVGRESVLTDGNSRLALWRKKLFIYLRRNSRPATDYFGIPPDQVVELGFQVSI